MNRPRMLGRLGTQTGGRVMTEKLLDSKNGLSLYRLALTDGKGEEVDVKFRLDGLGPEPALFKTEAEARARFQERSEEHTSELQSLMSISYAVFCLKKKNKQINN